MIITAQIISVDYVRHMFATWNRYSYWFYVYNLYIYFLHYCSEHGPMSCHFVVLVIYDTHY